MSAVFDRKDGSPPFKRPRLKTRNTDDINNVDPGQRVRTLDPKRKIFIDKDERRPQETRFSVFNAVLPHVDILLNIIKYLPPRTITYLYSMSAPFFYLFSSNYTTFILAATRIWAPNSEYIFPWKCYKELCIYDPAMRMPARFLANVSRFNINTYPSSTIPTNDPVVAFDTETFAPQSFFTSPPQPPPPHLPPPPPSNPEKQFPDFSSRPQKYIPSLRWLKMVVYRHFIVRSILAYLHTSGIPLSFTTTTTALLKMWFLLDLPLNVARIAMIQNRAYFLNTDLFAMMTFFIKFDMSCTDPINYTGGESIVRKCLLSEPTLTPLWDFLRRSAPENDHFPKTSYDSTLRRTTGFNHVDVLALFLRHCYSLPLHPPDDMPHEAKEKYYRGEGRIMGLALAECGRFGNELRGRGSEKLLRPDELVLREGVRRKLDMERYLLRMVRWGYVDKDFGETEVGKREDVWPELVWEREMTTRRKREGEMLERCTDVVVQLDVD